MRVSRFSFAVMTLLVLTSVPAAAATPPKPPADPIAASTARNIAEKLVNEEVRQDPRLETATFEYCARDPGRIDCLYSASGKTKNREFDCRLKVAVRAERQGPLGEIVARSCQVELLPLLTYAAAYEAMASVIAARLPGSFPTAFLLLRVSRSAFTGTAWIAEKGQLHCVRELTAERTFANSINVEIGDETCTVFS